jgi:hypothetical protein
LTQSTWVILNLNDQAQFADALSDISALLYAHPGALMEHDLAWIADTSAKNHGPVIYLCREGRSVLGYAPFIIHSSEIKFTLGEVTLRTYRVEEIALHGEPLFRPGMEPALQQQLLVRLLSQVRNHMTSGQVIFLPSVPSRGPLHTILKRRAAVRYHVLQYESDHKRRFISLPASFDEYLKQLGSRTRSDLNRNSRKLREHVDNHVVTKRYSDSSTVAEFLKSAEAISKKTYQWNLLKRGLHDRTFFEARLYAAARLGWLRCYVLYCSEQPVAFMVGYVCRGRYYSTDIGYDPEWAAWSVGNVLHCEVVRDLIEHAPHVKLFDFMGDRPTHARLSNGLFSEEASFYLFPNSMKGTVLYGALSMTETLSGVLARGLDRLGLKAKLRNVIRHISTARHRD